MPQKVLIVDDCPDIHELITASLCLEPIAFHSLADGSICMAEAVRLMPDLILLDVDMPGADGFEVCRILKAEPRTAHIPVVFLTGASSSEQKLEGLALGAVDYITKPFDTAELCARVKSALNAKLLLDRLAEQNRVLVDSERRFRLLVDQAADAMLLCDVQGRFVDVNRLACESLGYTREQLLAMSLCEVEIEHGANNPSELASRAARGPFTLNGTHRRRDGTTIPVEVRIGLIEMDGHPLVLALARDISERRHAEQVLRERGHLREAVAAMEHVLGIVGHELRTPLAGIRIMAEVLAEQAPAMQTEWTELISSILAEATRMSETLNTLLEAARLNSGKAQWNWTAFPIEPVVRGAVDSIRPLVDNSRISLVVAVDPSDSQMMGDADAIRRLILNLLSNSSRHTRDGSIAVAARKIDITGVPWIEIQVRDTGQGMLPHTLERLGEAFALNAGAVGTAKASGAGLGLAISKAIIAAHGGTFAVNSAVGHGTTVTVRLRADLPCAISNTGPTQFASQAATLPEAA